MTSRRPISRPSRATRACSSLAKLRRRPRFSAPRNDGTRTGVYPWIIRSTAMVNHYYVYILDRDFGPLFIKFCSYFPYPAKLCLNGHEWLKRQLTQRGMAFEPLDNGIRTSDESARVQRIADTLDASKIDAVFRKWLRRIPHPFAPAHRAAGYRYQLVDPSSRVRADPGAGSAAHRPLFLRRGDPRKSRPRSPRSDAADLRAPGEPPDTGALPHPCVDRGRRPVAPRAVQEVEGQAVPQRGPGPPHRNHHQRHL